MDGSFDVLDRLLRREQDATTRAQCFVGIVLESMSRIGGVTIIDASAVEPALRSMYPDEYSDWEERKKKDAAEGKEEQI